MASLYYIELNGGEESVQLAMELNAQELAFLEKLAAHVREQGPEQAECSGCAPTFIVYEELPRFSEAADWAVVS